MCLDYVLMAQIGIEVCAEVLSQKHSGIPRAERNQGCIINTHVDAFKAINNLVTPAQQRMWNVVVLDSFVKDI